MAEKEIGGIEKACNEFPHKTLNRVTVQRLLGMIRAIHIRPTDKSSVVETQCCTQAYTQ